MPSRAHLFYSPKKVTIGQEFESFVAHNCRRQSLLKSIGGLQDQYGHDFGCCDVCDGDTTNSRLSMLCSKGRKRRARRVQRAVNPNIEAKLMAAREEVLEEHPSLVLAFSAQIQP